MSDKETVELDEETYRILEFCTSKGMTVEDLEKAICEVVKKHE